MDDTESICLTTTVGGIPTESTVPKPCAHSRNYVRRKLVAAGLHDQDDGTPWPSIHQIVSTVATAATANSTNNVTTSGEGGNERKGDGGREGKFAVLFSKAMLHLARAASRARWGRSWAKVRQRRRSIARDGESLQFGVVKRSGRNDRSGARNQTAFLSIDPELIKCRAQDSSTYFCNLPLSLSVRCWRDQAHHT